MFFFVVSVGDARVGWSLFFILLGVALIHFWLNLIFDLPFGEWAYVGVSSVADAASVLVVCL